MFSQVTLHEANEEHLVHAYKSVCLVDIFESLTPQVHLELLNSGRNFALQAFLRRHKDHVVISGLGNEFLELVLEDSILRSAHIPSDCQDA